MTQRSDECFAQEFTLGPGSWEHVVTWVTPRIISLTEFVVEWTDEPPLVAVGRVGFNQIVDYTTFVHRPYPVEKLNSFLPVTVYAGQHVELRITGRGLVTIRPVFADDLALCRFCGAPPGRCRPAGQAEWGVSAACQCTCGILMT